MPFHDHIDHQGRRQTHHSFVRHQIDRPGAILEIGHHLTIAREHRCLVQSISCAGAVIALSLEAELSHSFFLVLDGLHEEIGATEFRREGGILWVRFNMLLAPDFLFSVIRHGNLALEPA